jgi:ribosome modulation factor
MHLSLLRVAGLSGFAALLMLFTPRVTATPASHGTGISQDRDDWERAPNGWNDIQRRGFHDGVEGARKDAGNHRQPDVNNRDEYRNPDVPREMRHAYRDAFRRGYEAGMSHLMSGGPGMQGPPMRESERQWNAPPNEFDQIRRQGFQDGIEGARKDFGNHRRPDVNNRDEYRRPHFPPEQREAYRDGFRRGYQVAMDHLMGTPR